MMFFNHRRKLKALMPLVFLGVTSCSLDTDLTVLQTSTEANVEATTTQLRAQLTLVANEIMIVQSNYTGFNVYGVCDPGGSQIDLTGPDFSNFSVGCSASGNWSASIDFTNVNDAQTMINVSQVDQYSNTNTSARSIPVERDCITFFATSIADQSSLFGRGSASNPVAICTNKQLDDLAGLASSNPLLGVNYELRNYIDLSAETINRINGPFTGVLEGNGLAIRNLQLLNVPGSTGLFQDVSGTIRNIRIENALVQNTTTPTSILGILAARLQTGGLIDNVHITGAIDTEGGSTIGGIVASTTQSSKIMNSTTDVSIVSSDPGNPLGSNIGGIAGINAGDIENCHSKGDVHGTLMVGGIVGASASLSTVPVVKDSTSSSRVTGTNQVGGVIGLNDGGEAENLQSSGVINPAVATSAMMGGVIGHNKDHDVAGLHFSGVINASAAQAGGLIGTITDNRIGASTPLYVDRSSFTGTLTNVSTATGTGGLVGGHFGTSGQNLEIRESFSTGNITGGSRTGGLVGEGLNVSISDSYYAHGSIITTPLSADVGGLIGRCTSSTLAKTYSSPALVTGSLPRMLVGFGFNTTTNTYYNSSLSLIGPGGTARTESEMRDHSLYTGFNLPGIWKTDLTKSLYPILGWQ